MKTSNLLLIAFTIMFLGAFFSAAYDHEGLIGLVGAIFFTITIALVASWGDD